MACLLLIQEDNLSDCQSSLLFSEFHRIEVYRSFKYKCLVDSCMIKLRTVSKENKLFRYSIEQGQTKEIEQCLLHVY